MNAQLFPSHQYFLHPIYIIISILVLLLLIPIHHAQEYNKDYYSRCSKSTTLICGKTTLEMVYPFWGGNRPSYCGLAGYELKCVNNDIPVISIGSGSQFRVVEINPFTNGLILERYDDHLINTCPTRLGSIILDQNLFSYGMGTVDLYVYSCPIIVSIPLMFGVRNNFSCSDLAKTEQVIFGMEFLLQGYVATLDALCRNPIRIPVDRKVVEDFANDVNLQPVALMKPRFEVHYIINKTACSECERSGGLCWRNTNSAEYSQCLYNPSGNTRNLRLKIGLGGGAAVISILFLLLLFFICYRRMKTRHSSSSYPKDVEAFIKKYGSSIPKSFRYSTLKKITNSFDNELGKGGYGNVYKGILSDGCVVAVKVLNETKGNGEDFMNEVASIGRTSHVNVVTLLGFVYEGRRRALIYEFMPNGSLEKFIYGTTPSLKGHLSWEKLHSIALGIARGLEYLHCGCTTHILHLDIKPHNILLDEYFCPKISDFGLAKLYTGREGIVSSIMQARGTIGYIAPEVFSRNFGQVSHKSDVYSYGMMILEMVGGRKNLDTRHDRTSEIYFPSWVYKHIEVNEEPSFADNMTEEENDIVRKMMIVGLWCIQTNPSQRPSICKVIEMFEGNVAALEIPPKPYLYSPSTSPSNSQHKTLSWTSS